jgi:hypothetical protein
MVTNYRRGALEKRKNPGLKAGTMAGGLTPESILDSPFLDGAKPLKMIDFPGVNDYISLGTGGVTDITNNLSIFIWVNPDATATSDYIAADLGASPNVRWSIEVDHEESDEFAVVISSDGTVDAGKFKRYGSEGDILISNDWHLIGFTFADNVLKLYHNGVETAVDKHFDGTVNSLGGNQNGILIGRTSNDLDGQALGFTMWSGSVLSDVEILEMYNGGVPLDPRNLTTNANLNGLWIWDKQITFPTVRNRIIT